MNPITNKISGIYKIVSPSGKIYIGQATDISDRVRRYRTLNCKGQKYLYSSLLKYGWENHTFEILQQIEESYLDNCEIGYIWKYKSTDRKVGLNLTTGGKRCKHSEESKLLIRANHPKCKKVFTVTEGVKKTYQSIGDAARLNGTTRRSIKQSINNNCKINKMIWKFVN